MTFPPRGFSLAWFEEVLTDPRWLGRIGTSVQVALASSILATVLGTMTALGLVRGRFRGRNAAYGLVLAPLIVPVVVVAIGMYLVWARGWTIGPVSVGGGLSGTLPGMVLAHTVMTMPFPVITVSASLLTVDRSLERAAASLGAGPARVFWHVTFPLILPGIVAGFVFAFLGSWDEVVVATFLSTPRFATLPVELFAAVRDTIEPTAAAVSTIMLAVGAVALTLIALIGRRATAR